MIKNDLFFTGTIGPILPLGHPIQLRQLLLLRKCGLTKPWLRCFHIYDTVKNAIAIGVQVYSTGSVICEGLFLLSNICRPVVHSTASVFRGNVERWSLDKYNLQQNIPFGPRLESVIHLVLSIPSSSDDKELVTVDIVLLGKDISNALLVLEPVVIEDSLSAVLPVLTPLGQIQCSAITLWNAYCSLYSLGGFPTSSHILKKIACIGQQCASRPELH